MTGDTDRVTRVAGLSYVDSDEPDARSGLATDADSRSARASETDMTPPPRRPCWRRVTGGSFALVVLGRRLTDRVPCGEIAVLRMAVGVGLWATTMTTIGVSMPDHPPTAVTVQPLEMQGSA